jgi:hypothetical protein
VRRALLLVVVLAFAAAYVRRADLLGFVPTPAIPMAAHDQYAAALVLTGVAATPEGQRWQAGADLGLNRPERQPAQHERAISFPGAPDQVASWQIDVRRGQRVRIDVRSRSAPLLELFDGHGARRTSARPRQVSLDYVADGDERLVARLQPLLGVRESMVVAQRVSASLEFPVPALAARAIGSAFGVPRAAGARRHEGIDIFAPRDTPVVAAADGRIGLQTTNGLGGNVVWLWVPEAGVSLYYAHLARHAVRPGARVAAGDVVGYVGNTGNARTTPPHLHFAVYARGEGAVDPVPYVVDPVRQAR